MAATETAKQNDAAPAEIVKQMIDSAPLVAMENQDPCKGKN